MEEFSAHVGIRMEENSVQDTTRFAGSKSNKAASGAGFESLLLNGSSLPNLNRRERRKYRSWTLQKGLLGNDKRGGKG